MSALKCFREVCGVALCVEKDAETACFGGCKESEREQV